MAVYEPEDGSISSNILWETFTVCDIENGPVEIVDLPIKKR